MKYIGSSLTFSGQSTMKKYIVFSLLWAFCQLPSLVSAQDNMLTLHSAPEGAEVYDNQGTYIGVTPLDVNLKNLDSYSTNYKIKMDGYYQSNVNIFKYDKNGNNSWCSFVVCKPCSEKITRKGAFKRPYAADTMAVKLSKKPKFDDYYVFPVAPTQVNLKSDQLVGYQGGDKMKWGSQDMEQFFGYQSSFSDYILYQFSDNIKGVHINPISKNGEDLMNDNKFYIQPILQNLQCDLQKISRHYFKGFITADIKWAVMGKKEGKRDTILTHTSHVVVTYATSVNYPSEMIFRAATRDFLGTDSLEAKIRKYVRTVHMASRGEVLKLNSPQHFIHWEGSKSLSEAVKTVVTIKTEDGFGSGFFINNDGYILSNDHVIDGQHDISVKLNGLKVKASVVKTNKDFDIALLKVDVQPAKVLPLATDSTLLLGGSVYAVGTPMSEELNQTITRGIISGFRKFQDRKFIQTDVSINPGNSGGPLIDDKGRIIAINTMKVNSDNAQGLGFSIPIQSALKMLNIEFQ